MQPDLKDVKLIQSQSSSTFKIEKIPIDINVIDQQEQQDQEQHEDQPGQINMANVQ